MTTATQRYTEHRFAPAPAQSRGRFYLVIAFILAATFFALAATSCAGVSARDEVGVPAALAAYAGEDGIKADIELSVTIAQREGRVGDSGVSIIREVANEVENALRAGDRGRAVTLWKAILPVGVTLRDIALDGIEARLANGEIGPTVADSFRETVNRFDSLMTQLGERL